MRKFKTYLITALLALSMGAPVLLPATAAAACSGNDSKGQVLQGVGQTGDCNADGLTNTIRSVVNIVGIIAGIVAVIMIIVSGFRYITSGGASEKVAAAKSSLIYALIGVAIVALSQFLVHFVLTQAANAPDNINNSSTKKHP